MGWHDKDKQREYNKRYMKEYRERNRDRLREMHAEYRRNNPDRIRDNNLRRLGFSAALFDAALISQEHSCAICGVDLRTLPSKAVHADHCHDTGMARGILCHACNTGLGAFADDAERLRKAIEYLKNPPLSLV